MGLICRGFVGWVVVVMVEVDFLCCWWVEVDGVLLNLLAWLWVLAVGFCWGLICGGLRWLSMEALGGSHGLRLPQCCGCHGSHRFNGVNVIWRE